MTIIGVMYGIGVDTENVTLNLLSDGIEDPVKQSDAQFSPALAFRAHDDVNPIR